MASAGTKLVLGIVGIGVAGIELGQLVKANETGLAELGDWMFEGMVAAVGVVLFLALAIIAWRTRQHRRRQRAQRDWLEWEPPVGTVSERWTVPAWPAAPPQAMPGPPLLPVVVAGPAAQPAQEDAVEHEQG